MIKVSVIVPVYNVEKYLAKCLQSLADCGMPDKELEVIIVDDETPDNSMAIAQQFVDKYTVFRTLSQKNKGLGGARNTGIANASGTYLFFLDSDDWIVPGVLQGLVQQAIENQLDVLEFGGAGIYPDGKISHYFDADSHGIIASGIEIYHQFRVQNSACNKLYRSDFLRENKISFLEKIYIEDFEFNTRVLLAAQRMLATPLILGQYLQSADSITRSTSPQKRAKMLSDIRVVLQRTHELYRQHSSISEPHRQFFLERMGLIVTIYFYQFWKDKVKFEEMEQAKNQLKKEQMFMVDFPLYNKPKNLFRLLFLKNFWLLRPIMIIRKML